MSTTILYPNPQTYNTVVSAVLAGNTAVLWVLNNRVAIQFQPSVSVGQKVNVTNPASASTFSGLVVMNGNSGLASAVNGSYGFVWSPTTSGQDNAAQAAVLNPTSIVTSATFYQV
jgi:hypothetical protein